MNISVMILSAVCFAAGAGLTAGHQLRAPVAADTGEVRSAEMFAPWTNPTPHTYREGDRLSQSYGSVIQVPDWNARGLPSPAADTHWVRYAETYLLVQSETEIIRDIVQVSWGIGRA